MRKLRRSRLKSMPLALGAIALGAFILALPPALFAAGNAKTLYARNCASCHGMSGNGDGPAASSLNPRPRPFSDSLKGKSNAWIAKAIRAGGPAVGESMLMPPHPNMTAAQLGAMVSYIKSL